MRGKECGRLERLVLHDTGEVLKIGIEDLESKPPHNLCSIYQNR
jgi:hypothetical protein